MSIMKLAVHGGEPVRKMPFPKRNLMTEKEKQVVLKVLDEAITSGDAFGYNGKWEQRYEKAFAEWMGGGFADGVNSGTNALFVALGALELDALSEVIVPPITDAGGVMPVLFAGCVPIMADSTTYSYNTCAEEIERVITPRVKAIIVAHIGGEPVNMEPVMAVANKHGLYVIEDCSQSHGALYQGQKVGTFGDIAIFSTMFSKLHCTGGQGGVVYTKDEELYWKVKRFADRGKPFNQTGKIDGVHNAVAGLNCNLSELPASIGFVQLEKLSYHIMQRRQLADSLNKRLQGCGSVCFGQFEVDVEPSFWFFRMKVPIENLNGSKKEFALALKAEGLPVTETYRYVPCENPWFKNQSVFGKSGFPWQCKDYHGERQPVFKFDNITQVTDTHFNLNIHENYSEKDIADIAEALFKVSHFYSK